MNSYIEDLPHDNSHEENPMDMLENLRINEVNDEDEDFEFPDTGPAELTLEHNSSQTMSIDLSVAITQTMRILCRDQKNQTQGVQMMNKEAQAKLVP